ncbi:MAG: histidine--tRNA ligase family protein, partial [Dehalococcoidia bacterium]|nr:histidine--tRNA ligase family protein [Dehalococcoidia bacterium]
MKNEGIRRCKGTRDLLPEEMQGFRFISDVFRSNCINWGYQEVRTPVLEYLHLFTATGTLTPAMLGRVYSFLDWDGWSGERVVLRPDGTIPVVRLYIENLLDRGVARLFYVTQVFAFEPTGRENRERWQCGVELLGDARIASDVEVISLAMDIWKELGLENVELRLSHTGLLRAIVARLSLEKEDESKLLGQLFDGNWEVLAGTVSKDVDVERLISILTSTRGKKAGFLNNLLAVFPSVATDLRASLDDFARLCQLLDAVGVSYVIDLSTAPGFEYYTGVCFQFWLSGRKVGGGGRYDRLVPLMGGGDVPACGFAIYMDPLIELVEPKARRRSDQGVLVCGLEVTPQVVSTCFALARLLRSAGYIAEVDFSGRRETAR